MSIGLAILVPPVAVAAAGADKDALLFNAALTLLCPPLGIVHALLVVLASPHKSPAPEDQMSVFIPAEEEIPPLPQATPSPPREPAGLRRVN